MSKSFSPKKKSPKKIIVIFFLVLLVILLVVLTTKYKLNLFSIKNVEVSLNGASCSTDSMIIKESNLVGEDFYNVDTNAVEAMLKKKFLCIKSVKVDIYFFNKVRINVSPRIPAVVLAQTDEPKIVETPEEASTSASFLKSLDFSNPVIIDNFLADNEGVIFAKKAEDLNLPVLFNNQKLSLGQKIDGNIFGNIVIIFQKTKEFGLNFNEAKFYSNDKLILNTTPKIVFDLDKEPKVQLASLQLILEEAKINDETVDFIDLRFDNPVVKYSTEKKGKNN